MNDKTQTQADTSKSNQADVKKAGYGNSAPGGRSDSDDMATSSQQQFGSDKPTPDERSNRDRTGKYDEADPIWVNPDVQMNNDSGNNQNAENSLVDSQTKAP